MNVLYDITTLGKIHCTPKVKPTGIHKATEALGIAIGNQENINLFLSSHPHLLAQTFKYLEDTGIFSTDQFLLSGLPNPSSGHYTKIAANSGKFNFGNLKQFTSEYFANSYIPEEVFNSGLIDVYHLNWRGNDKLPEHSFPNIVLTVFDVIAIKHPEWFVRPGQLNLHGQYLNTFIKSVRPWHTIAVNTESVKRDLLSLFPHISIEQIFVVPLAVSSKFGAVPSFDEIDAVRLKYNIPSGRKYILSVNTLEPRKNTISVTKAFSILAQEYEIDDCCLVLAGSKGWLSEDLLALDNNSFGKGNASIHITGYVDDEDLPTLYSGASLFCYPSLDEGFGLPVLEAMRAGVPVLTSNCPPLKETAGDGAEFAEPMNVNELAEKMFQILTEEKTSIALKERGLKRAETFTWDSSAKKMVDVYQKITARRKPGNKSSLKNLIPLSRDLNESKTAYRNSVVENKNNLKFISNEYQESRVFIVGNSQGIPTVDLQPLHKEFTFALDGFYLEYGNLDWKPSFYLAQNNTQDPEIIRTLNGLTGSKFFFEDSFRGYLRDGPGVFYFSRDSNHKETSDLAAYDFELADGLQGPGCPLCSAIQLAVFMGFSEIYLLNCRLEYTAWHESFRKLMEQKGRYIAINAFNGNNPIYHQFDYYSTFLEELILKFNRLERATLDETQAISFLLDSDYCDKGTMVDVGAHRGHSAKHFSHKNWTIFCFEPDPANREHLLRRFGKAWNVIIDNRAVSDHEAEDVSFFTSEESTGISALHSFRDSHTLSNRVNVTTVKNLLEEYGIESVDFLKIDVEGFDFNVLKGVPWEKVRPEVIECEFEDAKTLKMGHTWRDIAQFLKEKGYTIYISEWHPITRYGIPHDWNRLVPWPEKDVPSESWGNILAFKNDPGYGAISNAFRNVISFNPKTEPPTLYKESEPNKPNKWTPISDSWDVDNSNGLVILGNGPSLKNIDLNLLSSLETVGMNAAYRHWEAINWFPTYYCCLDSVVVESHAKEILSLINNRNENGIKLFFLHSNILEVYPEIEKIPIVLIFEKVYQDPPFKDLKHTTTGAGAAILGMALGYNHIFLLGVDCNYVEQINEAVVVEDQTLEITSTPENNPNYYFEGYQVAGDKFQIPNSLPNLHKKSWENVYTIAKNLGVEVTNCNSQSRVDVFKFADWRELPELPVLPQAIVQKEENESLVVNAKKIAQVSSQTIVFQNTINVIVTNLQPKKGFSISFMFEAGKSTLLPLTWECEINGEKVDLILNPRTIPYLYTLDLPFQLTGRNCSIKISNPRPTFSTRNSKDTNTCRVFCFRFHSEDQTPLPLPLFNGINYLLSNQDVAEAILGKTMKSAYFHYCNFGFKEGRRIFPDITLNGNSGTLEQYVKATFDGVTYLSENPDVRESVLKGKSPSGLHHFLNHGKIEGRTPPIQKSGSVILGTSTDYFNQKLEDCTNEIEQLRTALNEERNRTALNKAQQEKQIHELTIDAKRSHNWNTHQEQDILTLFSETRGLKRKLEAAKKAAALTLKREIDKIWNQITDKVKSLEFKLSNNESLISSLQLRVSSLTSFIEEKNSYLEKEVQLGKNQHLHLNKKLLDFENTAISKLTTLKRELNERAHRWEKIILDFQEIKKNSADHFSSLSKKVSENQNYTENSVKNIKEVYEKQFASIRRDLNANKEQGRTTQEQLSKSFSTSVEQAKKIEETIQEETKRNDALKLALNETQDQFHQIANSIKKQFVTELSSQKRLLGNLIKTERSERILDFARRDSTGQFPQKIIIQITIPRCGSTWVMDSLRCHPAIFMEPTALIFKQLNLMGGRYPSGLSNLDDAVKPIEVNSARNIGVKIPEFTVKDLDKEILGPMTSEPYALEKVHPQFFDFQADAFLKKVEEFESKYRVHFVFIYQYRDPKAAILSFLRYKKRDSKWFRNFPDNEVFEYYYKSYESLLTLARKKKGIVVTLEGIKQNHKGILTKIFDSLWEPNPASESIASYANNVTRRSKRLKSTFLQEESLQKKEDNFEALFMQHAEQMKAIYKCYHSLNRFKQLS